MAQQAQHTPFGAVVQPPTPPAILNDNVRSDAAVGLENTSDASHPPPSLYEPPSTRTSVERAKLGSEIDLPLMRAKSIDVDLEASNGASKRWPTQLGGDRPGNRRPGHASLAAFHSHKTVKEKNAAVVIVTKSVEYRDPVWPSRQELKKQAQAEKRARQRKNWNCLSGLTTKQRRCTQGLIFFLIICAAVGIGVGVSKAVGGAVLSGNGGAKKIPDDS